jgi:DNA polymerase, archaea type
MSTIARGTRSEVSTREDEWLWGWDDTPGIVSVWAQPDGRAYVWRRSEAGALLREDVRFRPWLLLAQLGDVEHLGAGLQPERANGPPGALCYRELEGDGELRYLVRADDFRTLTRAVLHGATLRWGRSAQPFTQLRELGPQQVLALPPEEQYLSPLAATTFVSSASSG